MWEERSAQFCTWVHRSGPLLIHKASHRELGRGQCAWYGRGPAGKSWGRDADRGAPSPIRSRVQAQTEAGSRRHPINWARLTQGGGSPHGLGLGCPHRRSLADQPSPLHAPSRRSGVRPLPLPTPDPLPADPYLSALRQSPRPCGRPGSLPRRAPRPLSQGRDLRAQTAGAAAPGTARSPASCRVRRALIGRAARPLSGAAQSEPRTTLWLQEGRGRGGRWLVRGTSPCGGTGLVTPPSPGRRLPGVPEIPAGPSLGPSAGPGGYRCLPRPQILCPPTVSTWQGQERTNPRLHPGVGGADDAHRVLGEGQSKISIRMRPRPRARSKGLER